MFLIIKKKKNNCGVNIFSRPEKLFHHQGSEILHQLIMTSSNARTQNCN